MTWLTANWHWVVTACAFVLFLDKDRPRTEVWVTEWRGEE